MDLHFLWDKKVLELYFSENITTEIVKLAISKVLPEGYDLLSVKKVPLLFPSIDRLVNVSEYKIKDIIVSQKEVDEFLLQDEIIIIKQKKDKIIPIDAKSLIRLLKIEGNDLILQLRFGSGKTVKPEMVLEKLLKLKIDELKVYSIKRSALYIETSNGTMYEP